MNRKRLPIFIALALVSGLLAGYLALSFLRNQPGRLAAAEPTSSGKVAVAAKDLPVGSVLKPEDVVMIDWPGNAVPAGYASNATAVVGRGLITSVSTNEPFLETKLASKEAGGGLTIIIPEGMRAVSVKVDEVIGVAGFVLPGTRVDVLVTIEPEVEGGKSETVTRAILQNVQTLAAGQTVQRDVEGKPQTVAVITLLVTPEQAEQLTLAANQGRIQLALRNTLDQAEVKTSGVRSASLVRGGATAPVAQRAVQIRPQQRPRSTGPAPSNSGTTVIETFRGGERTLSTFSSKSP